MDIHGFIFEMHAIIFLYKSGKEAEWVLTDLSGSNVLDIYENGVVIILKL